MTDQLPKSDKTSLTIPQHSYHTTPSPKSLEKPPWKKLLYLQQPYPDNYNDESFLSQLKRNTTVAKYSYLKLIDDFLLIMFYISCILLVNLLFIGIYLKNWNPIKPTIISSILSVIIYQFILKFHNFQRVSSSIKNLSINLKSFIIISFMILISSPILKSLTKSTSSDSIWAISFILNILNSIFFEYSSNEFTVYKPILSTNLSLSNSIVLASRLNSTIDVFLFILFAIEINILLPLFDSSFRNLKTPPNLKILHYLVVFITFNLVNYWIYELLNYKFLIYWLISVIIIIFIMPGYFLFLQRYKNELQGPWDIAKPKINKE
ncbi:GPI2 [Candida pseudojiufengensis]|uniref:GPI2 n=1 Tax=Candida pseudojiufengensis TaxID=497109 RepID=UPI0022250198|nr:GPI2 [Candida pseudojiufengensis]KAI5962622.1 GPI2 [Candida pseudojiufengensis]